ncbi:MAG TPA: hypothetical protein VF310_09160 [Vicinamibacteria bacterium]
MGKGPEPLPSIAYPAWLGAGEPAPPEKDKPAPAKDAPAAADAAKTKLIDDVLKVKGSADAADGALVRKELEKLPVEVLQAFKDRGGSVVVCRGSVVDYKTDKKDDHPRGWPAGKTWADVPAGRFGDEIVVATIGHGTAAGAHVPKAGEGHGSASVVIHEMFHIIDGDGDKSRSKGEDFLKARTADIDALSAYQKQAGSAGERETYAESAARYYSGDPKSAEKTPHLHAYWETNPLKPKP